MEDSGPSSFLTRRARYKIEAAQRTIHEAYWPKLCMFRVPSDLIAKSTWDESCQPPHKRPEELGQLLGSYACELLQVEEQWYPRHAHLQQWFANLAQRVAEIVMEKVGHVENIRYHATETEIMRAILDALGERVTTLLGESAIRPFTTISPGPIEAEPQSGISHPADLPEARKAFVTPILEEKGWSILDWANAAGVSHATAMDYLQEKTSPYQSTRLKLAKALGVPVDQLPK